MYNVQTGLKSDDPFEKHLNLCNKFEVVFFLLWMFDDVPSISYCFLNYALLVLIGVMLELIWSSILSTICSNDVVYCEIVVCNAICGVVIFYYDLCGSGLDCMKPDHNFSHSYYETYFVFLKYTVSPYVFKGTPFSVPAVDNYCFLLWFKKFTFAILFDVWVMKDIFWWSRIIWMC